MEAQKLNFNATCIKRGLLSVCVICPKFAESVNLRGKATCSARYSCGRVDEAARIEEFLNRWLTLFAFAQLVPDVAVKAMGRPGVVDAGHRANGNTRPPRDLSHSSANHQLR